MLWESKIGRKLLFFIILTSSFFSLLATLVQLGVEYKNERHNLDERLEVTLNSNLRAIVNNVWTTDYEQVQDHINDLSSLKDIAYVELKIKNDQPLIAGTALTDDFIVTQRDMLFFHEDENSTYNLGSLIFHSDLKYIDEILWDRFLLILLTQTAKTFIVSFFILYIIGYLLTRHLFTISMYTRNFRRGQKHATLKLENKKSCDELDEVVSGINRMKRALEHEIIKVHESKEALTLLNNSLEERVQEEIQKRKDKEQQLIEQEKMAAMGRMIASIAQEINTPIGTSITGMSVINTKMDMFAYKLENNELKKSELLTFCEDFKKASSTLLDALTSTGELVKNLKMLSMSDDYSEKRPVIIKDLIESIVRSYTPILKEKQCELMIECDPEFKFNTYLGAFSQIINNLIENALMHAFQTKKAGKIHIVVQHNSQELKLEISDNGDGISQEHISQIFDPFFTTNRSDGGTGLGLTIVYNIVTYKLDGEITCKSEVGSGTTFTIALPLD